MENPVSAAHEALVMNDPFKAKDGQNPDLEQDGDDLLLWDNPASDNPASSAEDPAKARSLTQPEPVKSPASVAKSPTPPAVDTTTALIKVKDAQKTLAELTAEQLSLFDVAPWGDDMRAIPNDLARTSLFTVRNKRVPREAFVAHPIFSYNQNVGLMYTGVELRADDDELVWQQVLEYSKKVALGERIYFSYYKLCNDIGWPTNGAYYDKAEKCLLRLNSATIQYASVSLGKLDSIKMVDGFKVRDRVKGGKPTCTLKIPEEMVFLFAGGNYTMFMWSKYRKLKPIARRLFDYFASHRAPYPLALDKFQLLCHSQTGRAGKWTEQTKNACEELRNSGLVQEAWVDGGKIYGRRYKLKE